MMVLAGLITAQKNNPSSGRTFKKTKQITTIIMVETRCPGSWTHLRQWGGCRRRRRRRREAHRVIGRTLASLVVVVLILRPVRCRRRRRAHALGLLGHLHDDGGRRRAQGAGVGVVALGGLRGGHAGQLVGEVGVAVGRVDVVHVGQDAVGLVEGVAWDHAFAEMTRQHCGVGVMGVLLIFKGPT